MRERLGEEPLLLGTYVGFLVAFIDRAAVLFARSGRSCFASYARDSQSDCRLHGSHMDL